MRPFCYSVFTFFLLTIQNSTLNAQWVQTSGLYANAQVTCFATIGSNLFVGTWYGAYRSSDNGTNWARISDESLYIRSLAAVGTNLFAGTPNGVYRSTDIGTSWTLVSSALVGNATNIRTLIANGTSLFAGTDSGVYKSGDNGTNWTVVNSGLPDLHITLLGAIGTSLFVATRDSGLYRSTDSGTTWTIPSKTFKGTHSGFTSFAAIGIYLFAGTASGVILTTDNGVKWKSVRTGLRSDNITALAAQGTTLFAGTPYGVCFSTNNGTSWSAANTGLTPGIAQDISAIAAKDTNLFIGTNGGGVYRSSDNVLNWNLVNNGLNGSLLSVYYLSVFGPSLFAAYTEDPSSRLSYGTFLSTDRGVNWKPITTLTERASVVEAFVMIGTNLFAGTNTGVYLSTDNGTTWVSVDSGLTNSFVTSLVVIGTNFFAGTHGEVFINPLIMAQAGVYQILQ